MTNLENYIRNSEIPKRYLQDIQLRPAMEDVQVFSELNDIKLNIVEFVKRGNNLLIYSNRVGNGKTSWATKILKQFINNVSDYRWLNNCPALFINVQSFLELKKSAITNKENQIKVDELEKKLLTAPIVLFDDLGVKNFSQYDIGTLYYWIDYRTSNLKSCIYTSNLSPSQLRSVLDERLYSRIVNYSYLKEIKDGDSREC